MGEQIGDNISWSVASPIFRLWAKWKLGRIIFTGFVSGQAEKEDIEEYSNAMVLFELDQLENLALFKSFEHSLFGKPGYVHRNVDAEGEHSKHEQDELQASAKILVLPSKLKDLRQRQRKGFIPSAA